ncbi:hypothetical protein REPUB_Repub18cG0036500 [Reevesia pubescens]
MVEADKQNQVSLFFNILWELWRNRNNCLHKSVCSFPSVLSDRVRRFEVELQHLSNRMMVPGEVMLHSWTKPSEGILKVNVDGSFDQGSRSACLGVVCIDHEGNISFFGVCKTGKCSDFFASGSFGY